MSMDVEPFLCVRYSEISQSDCITHIQTHAFLSLYSLAQM